MPFFLALEEEILKAEMAGKSIIVQLDANSKLGPDLVPGDRHQQSDNGRLLAQIISRHGLLIGNSLKQCKGLITRKKVTKERIEESTIDFVLLSPDLLKHINTIEVDENREKVLTKLTRTKNGVRKVESDHNPIITKLTINWHEDAKKNRIDLFNLKNNECQEKFKMETSSSWNDGALSSIFDQKEDLNILADRFLKKLDKITFKCFRKIRVTGKRDEEKETLLKTWNSLRARMILKAKLNLK